MPLNAETGPVWGPWALGQTDCPPAVAWEPNWAENRELGNHSDADLNRVLGFKAFLAVAGKPARHTEGLTNGD